MTTGNNLNYVIELKNNDKSQVKQIILIFVIMISIYSYKIT